MTPIDLLFAAATLLATSGQPTGSWSSDACGARKYRRTIEIMDDGTFTADDIPHPCPGECVVQHALRRTGTWKITTGVIRFTVKKTSDSSGQEAKAAQPLPAELVYDGKKRAMAELIDRAACLYQGS